MAQQGEAPPSSTFTPPAIPKTLRNCFAQSPDWEATSGFEGANAWLLRQVLQDRPITHRNALAQNKRYQPEGLYTMLPQPQRVLYGRAMYGMNSLDTETHKAGTDRTSSNVAVATDVKHLPGSSMAKRSGRVLFNSPLQQDAVTARFMASVITNICERIHVALSEIDQPLMDFITATAERHAGITLHQLPEVQVCLPSSQLPARVESTVPVMYRGSLPGGMRGTLQVVSSSLSISLAQVPNGPAPGTPSAFLLPFEPILPSEASIGFSNDTMRRAIQAMHWMQSHVHTKVFAAESDFNQFASFLIQLTCPVAAPRHDSAGHGGLLFGRENLFDVKCSGRDYRYRIVAREPVQAEFGGALPNIVMPDSRKSLLRVIERLDTVFLATGRLEDGWEAACHRADVELETVSEEGNYGLELRDCMFPMCDCLYEERPNAVHRCDNCVKKLLCETQYQSATEPPIDVTLCLDCRPTRRPGR